MGRARSEPWGDFCARHLRRLCRAKFFPMASLVIGLPGESDEHVQETLAWVESLRGERMAVFPRPLAPVDGTAAARSAPPAAFALGVDQGLLPLELPLGPLDLPRQPGRGRRVPAPVHGRCN